MRKFLLSAGVLLVTPACGTDEGAVDTALSMPETRTADLGGALATAAYAGHLRDLIRDQA